MAGINTGKVLVGGLAAGLVINISETILNTVVLGADMEAALARLNLPPVGGGAIAQFVVLSFVFGVILAWLYAAVRPRLGPGSGTAMKVGLLAWFLYYAAPSIGYSAMGLFPAGLLAVASVWTLVETIAAALVAGYLYQE